MACSSRPDSSSPSLAHWCRYLRALKTLALLHLTNLVGIALTFGLYIPWAKVRLARYRIEHLQLLAAGELDAFAAGEQQNVTSTGEEIGEMFDLAIGV